MRSLRVLGEVWLTAAVALLVTGCTARQVNPPVPPSVQAPSTSPASPLAAAATPGSDEGLPPPASDPIFGEMTASQGRPPFSSSEVNVAPGEHLLVPVAGVGATTLRDNFSEMRGSRPHRALDIPAKRGTPVVAVDDGPIRKLFTSDKGGLTVYQFDRDGKLCFYYAHLEAYADGMREGDLVRRGALIGYVGTSGNAPEDAPHLHFEVARVGARGEWYGGEPMNPYPMMVNP